MQKSPSHTYHNSNHNNQNNRNQIMTSQCQFTLGIDPGVNGGMCLLNSNNDIVLLEAWSTESAFVEHLDECIEISGGNLTAYVEKVASMPAQGVVSVFTFGENFGFLKGAIRGLKVSLNLVLPKEWQTPLRLKKAATKTIHKNLLKDCATRFYPKYKFTLKTCDAALIARHGFLNNQ